MAQTAQPDGPTLEQDFQFYRTHQDEMVAQYDGRVVAIKNGVVLGDYGSYLEALTETAKAHDEGTFLLQKVSEGGADYTSTYSSRVSFA